MSQVKQISPWQEVRLRCAIGHSYPGRVRVVQDRGHDMDGEELWSPNRPDYDPDTCIVCGLKTWAVDA